MPQGLEVYNDKGVLQIGAHPTLEVYSYWSVPSSGWTPEATVFGNLIYTFRSYSVTLPSEDCFLAFSGLSGGDIGVRGYTVSGNTHTLSLVSTSTANASKCRIYVIGPAKSTSSWGGLEVWDESGKKLFNASNQPVHVSGVYPDVPESVNYGSYTFPTYTVPHNNVRVLVPVINYLLLTYPVAEQGINLIYRFSYGFEFTSTRAVRVKLMYCQRHTHPYMIGGQSKVLRFPIFHIPE